MTEMSLDDVLAALDLRRCSPDTFLGTCLPLPGERVFGGQFLAQAVVAAGRTVGDNTTAPHSLHAYFLRPGDPREPVRFRVDRLRDGHPARTRGVEAVQHGRTVFHLLASFRDPESGPCHQDTAPVVPAPETLPQRYPFGASTGPLVLCRVPDGARGSGGAR
ncbi:acyl-CoA thioesterase, partial [Saccharomonospora iraqiensis]|uniref:acyl-CoA thioesterase n=1 Tax=Saccharomonospora iraqiensis TaxID=52698 RepID=UPI00022DF907